MNTQKNQPLSDRFIDEIPESAEMREDLRDDFERFCDQIVQDQFQLFWPNRPVHPELNGSAVTEVELKNRVVPKFRASVKESLLGVKPIVDAAPDKDEALERMSTFMFGIMARNLIEEGYEVIANIKKTGIDSLTGLPNRKIFERNISACVKNHERFGQTFSVIVFDLDHFKRVNDTYGHGAGDDVLKEVARRLTEDAKIRDLDAAMRYGGEEFVMILPSTPKEGACIVAQRILKAIGDTPFFIKDKEGRHLNIPLTTSIGVAEFQPPEQEEKYLGEATFDRADANMYILKGEDADAEGVLENRRNHVACDRRVLSEDDIQSFKSRFQGAGRSSFPAPKRPSGSRLTAL